MENKRVYIDLQPLLKRKGINMNQLSMKTKIHRSILHKLESEKSKRATISVLEAICTVTHAHLSEFMFIEGEEPEPIVSLPPFDDKESEIHLTCNLSSLLKRKGVSLHQFSKDIDETYNNLWKIASNKSKQWSFSTIGKLVTHLDCSINELFTAHIIAKQPEYIHEAISPYGEEEYKIYFVLNEILEKRNMSMLELSQKTELPYEFIKRLKNNDVQLLDIKSFEKVCNYLKISPHDIIRYDKKK